MQIIINLAISWGGHFTLFCVDVFLYFCISVNQRLEYQFTSLPLYEIWLFVLIVIFKGICFGHI